MRGLRVGVVALLLPGAAAAQPQDEPTIDAHVRAGQLVAATDASGRTVKGRVTSVDAFTLTLLVEDGFDRRSVALAASDVSAIRKIDPLLNGFLIGLGSGLAAGEVWIYGMCGPPGYDAECRALATPIGWAAFGGGGVALGTLIDKLNTKLLYRASGDGSGGAHTGTRGWHLQPLLARDAQGLRVSLSF